MVVLLVNNLTVIRNRFYVRLNKILLIGRLTRDMEVRALNNGKFAVSFAVATDEGYKDKNTGEWVDKAEFTDVSYFTTEGGVNFMTPRLHKGSLVYVEGRKETQKYEKDGETRYAVKCIASEVRPLEKGVSESNGQQDNNAGGGDYNTGFEESPF